MIDGVAIAVSPESCHSTLDLRLCQPDPLEANLTNT